MKTISDLLRFETMLRSVGVPAVETHTLSERGFHTVPEARHAIVMNRVLWYLFDEEEEFLGVYDFSLSTFQESLHRAPPSTSDESQVALPPRLDEIKARLAAATPGPWVLAEGSSWRRLLGQNETPVLVPAPYSDQDPHPTLDATRADFELITQAPTDLAWLIEEVEALRKILLRALRKILLRRASST